MTDTIRDLLISLASHMAYMQGQLEARHELDDPEDYYWYRESVLLRQKVTDALADGPAVPEGREPTRDELWELWLRLNNELLDRSAAVAEFWEHAQINARARWGNPAPQPPAEGEVEELVVELRMMASQAAEACQFTDAENLSRAADLLQRLSPPQPVPVSERLPGAEDCDAEGRCWWLHAGEDGVGDWFQRAPYPSVTSYAFFRMTHWLPAHALPVPHQQENAND